jgi:hypothetical protein
MATWCHKETPKTSDILNLHGYIMEQISGPRNAKALPLQGFQCSDPNYEGWNFRLTAKSEMRSEPVNGMFKIRYSLSGNHAA